MRKSQSAFNWRQGVPLSRSERRLSPHLPDWVAGHLARDHSASHLLTRFLFDESGVAPRLATALHEARAILSGAEVKHGHRVQWPIAKSSNATAQGACAGLDSSSNADRGAIPCQKCCRMAAFGSNSARFHNRNTGSAPQNHCKPSPTGANSSQTSPCPPSISPYHSGPFPRHPAQARSHNHHRQLFRIDAPCIERPFL